MDLLGLLTALVTDVAASPWVYLVVFAVCFVDGFFPPVPSETVVVGAATISVATGQPQLLLLIGAAAAGAVLGDNAAYQLGRMLGTDRSGGCARSVWPRPSSGLAAVSTAAERS